jgi:tRNA nucleotidyltransferase/poly(A) polymerase
VRSYSEQLAYAVNTIRDEFNLDEYYIFGGALRDILFEREVGDFDIKLKMTPSELIKILEAKGFTETDDFHFPQGSFFYNRRFNAIALKKGDIMFDFSFLNELDIDNRYSRSDINFNALVFDTKNKTVLNPVIVPNNEP